MRTASIKRQTNETTVDVALNLDGQGQADICTGVGFLDHMLTHLAFQACFDLTVRAAGDLVVDEHHTVEDVAVAMGQALDQVLGQRQGIARMAHAYVPMDDALARVAVDLGGRAYAVIEASFATPRLGTMATDLIPHFLEALASHGRLNLHAHILYGQNDHHKAEALFKALGRALGQATATDPRRAGVASTKGVI